MKIEKLGESYYNKKLIDCTIYVRKDLTVVRATQVFYRYVGDNQYFPVSSMIAPGDGELLLAYAENPTDKIELITYFTDKQGGIRNVYLRMEPSQETENGTPLFEITLYNIEDIEARMKEGEVNLAKYRYFLTLNSEGCNEYFFEYYVEDDHIIIYKYINERVMRVWGGHLDDFVKQMDEENNPTDEQREQMETFCDYLRNMNNSFEMEFTMINQDNVSTCRVKGGRLYKNKGIVVGFMIPNQLTEKEAYYMTPAAKDAGTGLLNKRAITEYTMERLHMNDGAVRWFVLFDIDDFKDINDTFGHLFGDEVIRKVADVLQQNVGYRGAVGRFGGDEFFVLLERVPDRASLKVLLRAITMELQFAYDPKLKIKASIGVSQYPVDGKSYEKLFEKADKALYIAKEKGKDRHIIYDEKMHGAVKKDELQTMKVAYMVSREKRKAALVDIMTNVCKQGVGYVIDNPTAQKLLRDVYDLDGITIYTDYGRKVVCRSGIYGNDMQEIPIVFRDEKVAELFGKSDVLAEPHLIGLKGAHAEAYIEYARQEIGAFIQCIARKEGVPYALVSFEVLNRNRKWSDTESEMLGLIGSCIAQLLCNADDKEC